MAKRLIFLSVLVVLALSALGLVVTESSGGPETEGAAFYLVAVGVALVAVTGAGLVYARGRRGRR
jgi:hypothetical protein